MFNSKLISLTEAACLLEISEPVIVKFIKRGLISSVLRGNARMLTPYGIRRLTRIVDMYEKSFSIELIEKELNN